MQNNITVSAINIYPVKSCKGIPYNSWHIGPHGFDYDRQWMFIDKDNNFVAQRGSAELKTKGIIPLCQVRTAIEEKYLTLSAPGHPGLYTPLDGEPGGNVHNVRIWNSFTEAFEQPTGSYWGNEFILKQIPEKDRNESLSYKMVRMPDNGFRNSRLGEGQLCFADAFPFMIVSEESLNALNCRLKEPLPMDRFRPNIVIKGCGAYNEDTLPSFKIGNVEFINMGACVRCPITTTNQNTGERGKEPLKTLATYRRSSDGNGVIFGCNYNHNGTGTISVGDELVFL